MDQATRLFVRERAGERCEYCQRTQAESPMAKLQVEHILPIKHGGGDDLANLALACLACNLHKGPNLTGIDPQTGAVVELFHPRRQRWEEHFAWKGCRIVGQTAVGRTTVCPRDELDRSPQVSTGEVLTRSRQRSRSLVSVESQN